ncbi:hypothetical protein ACSBR1_025262 [Camellia fascicularis]
MVISHWSDNIFLFQFDDAADRQKILMEAPWSVMGFLLVLQPLAIGRSAAEMDFKRSPFWVQIHVSFGFQWKWMSQNPSLGGSYYSTKDLKIRNPGSPIKGQKSGYGPDLRTSRAPYLGIPMTELRHWVDNAEDRVRNLVRNWPVTASKEDACNMARKDNTSTEDPGGAAPEDRGNIQREDVV